MTRKQIRAPKRPRNTTGQTASRGDQVEVQRKKRRARLDKRADSVLAVPSGTTEVIGTPAEQPDAGVREQANEIYVRTFNQKVGE